MSQPQAYKQDLTRREYNRNIKLETFKAMVKIKLNSIPYLGSEKRMMDEQKKIKMKLTTAQITTKTLGYFRWHNEIHETRNLLGMIRFLSREEADLFDVDIRRIDMRQHAQVFMYGVGKYYCGLDILPPDDPQQQILKLNCIDYNHDIKFALDSVVQFKKQDLGAYFSSTLDNSKF